MIKYIFTFTGRMNRKPYWIGTVLVLLALFLPIFGFGFVATLEFSNSVLAGVAALAAIPFLLGLVASVSIGIRRLHDRNKGWVWFAFLYGLPFILSGAGGYYLLAESHPVNLLSWAISLWAFVELGFMRGTPGGNQYGPDPLSGDVVDNRAFD